MTAVEALRRKAHEYELAAEHQAELEEGQAADDFRAVVIALLEVARALEDEAA